MKILIDIGHPAHVHLFKHFAWEMQNNGNSVLFTARDKEHEIYLLEKYKFRYVSFGNHFKGTIGKLFGLLKFNAKMLWHSYKYRPDIFLSHGSIYAAQVSWLLRKPHIALEDTGNREQVCLYLPFTKTVLTSTCFPFNYGNKQKRYNSHHEIAYLQPNYFKPNQFFGQNFALQNEKYVIFRFVSWNATHDSGQSGLKKDTKARLVEFLSKKYKVFISSEEKLPIEYRKYQIDFSPEDMHHALYFAELFIGEGTTMAMEAAILGTPSIYVNSLQYANIKDMEQYGLLYSFRNDDNLIEKINEIISIPDLKQEFQIRREKMLDEKIDLTAFLLWFIEKYPESEIVLNKNSDFPDKFR